MATVRQLLQAGADLPGESARRDAEILLGHCLAKARSWLYAWPEREVTVDEAHSYHALLVRRREGEPVAYLTGEREFWSLSLAVDSATLIPRPETETLVSWALEVATPGEDAPAYAAKKVLDLGTGSGAIALALASERPAWSVVALDSCPSALAVAASNARNNALHTVRFLQSSWYAELQDEVFDLIVANPPYIDPGDAHLQQGDLRYEPRSALVAQKGGMADLEVIIAGAEQHLVRGGWLITEHGFEQGEAVRERFAAGGFLQVETRCDLAGRERVTGGQLPLPRESAQC